MTGGHSLGAAGDGAHRGNVTAGLGDLLAGLGIQDVEVRETVEDAVQQYLGRRSLAAQVTGIRWGHLTLHAGPQAAALLRMERDALLRHLEAGHPGVVTRVSVHVSRA